MSTAERVAAIIVNYNMPERTDSLCEHIEKFVEWPVSLFVVDNGSDLVQPSRYTTLRLRENVQTTAGWLAGMYQAVPRGEWLAYWFLITSMEFIGKEDPLTPMAEFLLGVGQAVGVHPALTPNSTSDWPHLFDRGSGLPRRTWHIDNIASLYRADWFDEVGGFDRRMSFAWGIDLDLGWKARSRHRSLYVHEGCRVKKTTDIGYSMNRMNMTADERRKCAGVEMSIVLTMKYGSNWWNRVTGEFVTDEMLMPGEYRDLERATTWQ